jgi:broad specificity phosphatase PhoE
MATSEKDTMKRRVVVVVRHGERLDYVMRDAGQNWVASAFRPWDPPLTTDGMEQAKSLGKALPQILEQHKLPPKVKSIYSSPFLRCRQTALGIAESITSDDDDDSNTKVKVELGLAESINENWFRSWAVEGTDGTWGYLKKTMPELDPITLHPASQMPVQPLLDWQASGDETAASHPCMDPAHTSKSTLDTPYQLNPPKFESFKMQRTRMEQTLTQLSGDHIDETIVMVSHGTYVILDGLCSAFDLVPKSNCRNAGQMLSLERFQYSI